MRTLTVRRENRFAGGRGEFRLLIEDEAGTETVCGTKCSFLGYLENGEEHTFSVPDGDRRIFVTGNTIPKKQCSDLVRLAPQGDVSLTGHCKLVPCGGVRFYFDDVHEEETLENRKLAVLQGLLVRLLAVLIGVTLGFIFVLADKALGWGLFDRPTPEDFSWNGMTVTLTDKFDETALSGYDKAYSSKDCAVLINRDDFSAISIPDTLTAEDYLLYLRENNVDRDPSVPIRLRDGLVCFEYINRADDSDKEYRYFVFAFRTDDAYWRIQFVIENKPFDIGASTVKKYARSIIFDS